MNKIIQWVKRLWNRLFPKSGQTFTPTTERSTLIFTPPKGQKVQRITIKHPLGIGHSMHRLKGIGGHPVRSACSTRAFKIAFLKEYGVKLT